MTIADVTPLLKLYEEAVVEIYALRATLADLEHWDDEMVNTNKEKYRKAVSAQFEVLYQLSNNPVKLNEVLEGILQSNKSN